ncbi:glycosyltransferase family 2 protein [Parerythrobacter aestuarii]|uniref:glycosyltransferase family 2 protein n=1 Tax=Parerythrobacter aestuarii TaxID=3020909 RepID=UPI0024DE4CAF|nr:glycosyltransferase family 2 protein [Parerythrobacter aestuarii]
MAASPGSLTVVILTHNEEIHIERVLQSVEAIATRMIIVDSGSSDRTCELARASGAEVFERAWVNYADQFQWALDNCAIDTDWTMRLDADEWLGSDLTDRLAALLPALGPDITGISIDRQHHFMGRWIRHGGRYPLRLLRLWRTGQGRIEQRWMDEHIVIDGGEIRHVPGTFVDQNDHGLDFFIAKHNGYATREAIDALIAKYDLFTAVEQAGLASTVQANRTRSHKMGWYNRLPTGVGPLLYFLFRYLIQLGFLDGRTGLIYHVLQGFWYRFLVDAKRVELEQVIAGVSSNEQRIAMLTDATGHDLSGFQRRSEN